MHIKVESLISLNILKSPMDIIIPTPREIIITINWDFIPMAPETSLAKIKRSGSAIDMVKPIKIPNIITFIILENLAKNSPIIVPI